MSILSSHCASISLPNSWPLRPILSFSPRMQHITGVLHFSWTEMRCICHSWRFDLQRIRLRRSSSCHPANIAAKRGSLITSVVGLLCQTKVNLRNIENMTEVPVWYTSSFKITESRVTCSGLYLHFNPLGLMHDNHTWFSQCLHQVSNGWVNPTIFIYHHIIEWSKHQPEVMKRKGTLWWFFALWHGFQCSDATCTRRLHKRNNRAWISRVIERHGAKVFSKHGIKLMVRTSHKFLSSLGCLTSLSQTIWPAACVHII